MVTDWEGAGVLKLTGPGGRKEIEPPAVVLATGCRERPRSARLVPGSRPAGVMTTSTLQQLVHLRGEKVGDRAVIVGAEHVSFSAVATLAHGGRIRRGTGHRPAEAPVAGAVPGRCRGSLPGPCLVADGYQRDPGRDRVESVELTDLDSGRTRTVECDLVIFTADWIPDHELAVMAGCELDPGTLGPVVDPALRTTAPGVFAAGNLLHPAETADVCALDGRHVAARSPRISRRRRVAGPASGSSRGSRSPGSRRTSCWRPVSRRRAIGFCCARSSSSGAPGSRSARTAACSGAAGLGASSPDARRTSRPGWAAAVDPEARPA